MIAFSNYCMDIYEAPNKKNAKPLAFMTAIDGERWCTNVGKRLCTENEWNNACSGNGANLKYPYGNEHKKGNCNEDKVWKAPNWRLLAKYPHQDAMNEAARLYNAEESGKRETCISKQKVFDLTGNVAEWVRVSIHHPRNYTHVVKGCYWSGCFGGTKPNCAFRNPAHPASFRSYEFGFRCCKNI